MKRHRSNLILFHIYFFLSVVHWIQYISKWATGNTSRLEDIIKVNITELRREHVKLIEADHDGA
jgi:hypothetical protein